MKITTKTKGKKIFFEIVADPNARRRSSQKIIFKNNSVESLLRKKYNLDDYVFLTGESDKHDLTVSNTIGNYTFEKKQVDIVKESVRIDEPKVEVEDLKIDETSLSTDSLQYGLKSTTVKKKTTKNKKTEG